MRASVLLVLFALLLSIRPVLANDEVGPVVSGPAGKKAFDDLAHWYDGQGDLACETLVERLASPDAAERKEACDYLHALFAQLLDDETNGRVDLERLFRWGGGVRSRARDTRESLAKEFAAKAEGAEALKAARWLVEQETLAECQQHGIAALRRIQAPETADVFKQIVARPHSNGAVLVGAIEEIGDRELTALAPEVLRLRNHYRSAVRDAVRRTAEKLGVETPSGPFEPEEAFTPRLDQQLARIASMVLPGAPKDATWITYEYTVHFRDGDSRKYTYGGWLLDEDDASYHVLDYYAQEWRPEKKQTRITSRNLAEAAKGLIALRQEDPSEARNELSSGGAFTAQFEPGFITVPELLVAAWSHERGDRATAAAVLFPRIDETADDQWIEWAARDLLGHQYHKSMLVAFAYDRDYGEARRLAEHLSQPQFANYMYQARAVELAAQLAEREGDFKDFVLPSPDEWKKIAKTMLREDQIVYLAERLRLLNCIQYAQPGDVDYRDAQFAAPHLEFDPVERMRKPPEVVNPYNELMRLRITVGELPILMPFLKDDRFMPTFSYWRTFHHSRTLHRVNWAVANVVNNAAKRHLVAIDDYEPLDATGREKYLQDALAWCRANAGKSDEELILATMKNSESWSEFHDAAKGAANQGYRSAFPILLERLPDFPGYFEDLAELAYELNTADAVPIARKWLTDTNEDVRFWATMILLRHGGVSRFAGFAEIRAILDTDDNSYLLPRAINGLLSMNDERATALAATILKNEEFRPEPGAAEVILHRLFLAGRKECLRYLLVRLSPSAKADEYAIEECDCVALMVAQWRNDAYEYDPNAPAKEKEAKRRELKRWLYDQHQLLRQGKNPDMKTEPGDLRIPEWQFDAP